MEFLNEMKNSIYAGMDFFLQKNTRLGDTSVGGVENKGTSV